MKVEIADTAPPDVIKLRLAKVFGGVALMGCKPPLGGNDNYSCIVIISDDGIVTGSNGADELALRFYPGGWKGGVVK